MIRSKDRAFWFGASDTKFVMGNWETPTFRSWWLEKLGLRKSSFSSIAMQTGSILEHKILALNPRVAETDLQLRFPDIRLRVNLDGSGCDYICEVKTHSKPFKVTKPYWMQAQVEMYAWQREYGVIPDLEILSYLVTEHDYKNWFLEIEESRMEYHRVDYDEGFISEYLIRLERLKTCMQKGIMP